MPLDSPSEDMRNSIRGYVKFNEENLPRMEFLKKVQHNAECFGFALRFQRSRCVTLVQTSGEVEMVTGKFLGTRIVVCCARQISTVPTTTQADNASLRSRLQQGPRRRFGTMEPPSPQRGDTRQLPSQRETTIICLILWFLKTIYPLTFSEKQKACIRVGGRST